MLIMAYPVIFHLAALLGKSNMYKPEHLGKMIFPMAIFVIFAVMLLATVVTYFISRAAGESERYKGDNQDNSQQSGDEAYGEASDFSDLNQEDYSGDADSEELEVDAYEIDEEYDESLERSIERSVTNSINNLKDKSTSKLVAKTTSQLITENPEEKVREVVRAQEPLSDKKKRRRKEIRRRVPVLLLLGISLLLRLPMIGTFQRWDAGEYFFTVGTSVQDYQFTLPNFLYNFSVAYHLNYGFTSFIAIPLFLNARSAVAITIWQILFSVLAILALYKVFRIDFGFRRSVSAVAALMVGNVPIFLGLSAYCTPDYYLVLFFIFALYFEAKKMHILEVFMLLMMCFTKENSALIVFGYYGVKLLYKFIIAGKLIGKKKAGFINRCKVVFTSREFWVAFSVGVIFVAAMFMQGSSWADKSTATGVAPTTISFEKPYIYFKLKPYYGSNFAWLISLYFLHAFKTVIIEKRWKNLKHKGWMTYCGLTGAMFCFLAFGLLFHISALERYNTFFAVGLAFSCAIILGADLRSKWSYAILGGVLSIILGIESFVTIDPMTKWLFPQVSIGDNTMNFESEFMEYFGDGLVTNYQYAWLDKAFDKFLDDVDYSTDNAIYFPAEESGIKSGVQFDGNGPFFRIGWFPEEKKRDYYDYNMSGWEELYINTIYTDDTWFPYIYVPYARNVKSEYMKDRSYACFIPYYEEVNVNEDYYTNVLKEYYYVGKKQKANAYRGTINYYPLLIRDEFASGLSMDTVIQELRAGEDEGEIGYQGGSTLVTTSEKNDAVEKLAKQKMVEYLVVDELNPEARTEIHEMDSISLLVELYDSSGKVISLKHDEEKIVGVGTGELIDEIDKALLSMNCGETADVEFEVPYGYPELEEYAGQTLIARISPQFIVCRMRYGIEDEDRDAIYEEVKAEVDEYYQKVEARRWVQSYIAKNGKDNLSGMVTEGEVEEVRIYYYEYLERIKKTRDEFQEWIGVTSEEYDQALAVIAAYKKYAGK